MEHGMPGIELRHSRGNVMANGALGSPGASRREASLLPPSVCLASPRTRTGSHERWQRPAQ